MDISPLTISHKQTTGIFARVYWHDTHIYVPEYGLYPYVGLVVMGPVWSNNPESNVVANAATRRASHAEQGKGDDADENGYREHPGLGLGEGLKTKFLNF